MIKNIAPLLFIFWGGPAQANITECSFNNKIVTKIVKKIEPYQSCQQANDSHDRIVGYKIIKDGNSISIGIGDKKDFLPENLLVDSKTIPLIELFESIYSKSHKPVNTYSKVQKMRLGSAASYGVINTKDYRAFIEFNSPQAAYLNTFIFFDNDQPNQYVLIGLEKNEFTTEILF